MSIAGKRRLAAAGFVALLALSVFWPAPVLTINDLCCRAALPIDATSFLGREAPSWDVVFWCIAGLFTIAVLQAFDFAWRDFGDAWRRLRAFRVRVPRPAALGIAAAVASALVLVTWRHLDAPITAWAERVDSARIEAVMSIFNRLGGGINPALVVLFFVVAGVVSAYPSWTRLGVAMGLAGLAAGITAQVIKVAVARVRPELWLGPFVRATHGATSFPSGHTIGSFALAGVLLFGSRSLPLRVVAILLACAVALARVFAFRHWGSDVLASALMGLFAAWLAERGMAEEP